MLSFLTNECTTAGINTDTEVYRLLQEGAEETKARTEKEVLPTLLVIQMPHFVMHQGKRSSPLTELSVGHFTEHHR